MPTRLRRALFLIHRWLGVALALLMALWAASGVVMMYVAYPATSQEERLAGLAPLDTLGCCAIELPAGEIGGAAVEMLDGRPVLLAPGAAPVDLRGGRAPRIDREFASRVAQVHLKRFAAPRAIEAIANDQWTVSDEFREHVPLYKVTAGDPVGTVLYISGVTGQVVQDTTRAERFWNWLGAIPHWLYFKQLRANGPVWSQVVIYASLLGTFLTVIGLYIGVTQIGRKGRRIPYRGAAWWHHVTGLVFGLFTLTWVASGLFSMNPWGWMASDGPGEELAALAGRPPSAADARALLDALAFAPPTDAVRAELTVQGGVAYAILSDRSGRAWRASLADLAPAPLDRHQLDALAKRGRPERIVSAKMIREPDAYYYGHHSEVTLPAWRVIYSDPERTRLYFDPATGELVGFADSASRKYRWWHSALHSFDFAAALRLRPVWDIVVLPLMLGVTFLTLIGVWLGAQRLRRTFARRR